MAAEKSGSANPIPSLDSQLTSPLREKLIEHQKQTIDSLRHVIDQTTRGKPSEATIRSLNELLERNENMILSFRKIAEEQAQKLAALEGQVNASGSGSGSGQVAQQPSGIDLPTVKARTGLQSNDDALRCAELQKTELLSELSRVKSDCDNSQAEIHTLRRELAEMATLREELEAFRLHPMRDEIERLRRRLIPQDAVLAVQVVEARDLARTSRFVKLDPYVELKYGGKTVRTAVKHETTSPVFRETFEFHLSNDQAMIEIRVADRDMLSATEKIGAGRLLLADAEIAIFQTRRQWLPISLDGKQTGVVLLEYEIRHPKIVELHRIITEQAEQLTALNHKLEDLQHHIASCPALSARSGQTTPSICGSEGVSCASSLGSGTGSASSGSSIITNSTLPALVVQVREIKGMNKVCDPYLKLTVGASERTTTTKRRTCNPIFNETFQFIVTPDMAVDSLVLDAYDTVSGFLGTTSLSLTSLPDVITEHSAKLSLNGVVIGEVLLNLRLDTRQQLQHTVSLLKTRLAELEKRAMTDMMALMISVASVKELPEKYAAGGAILRLNLGPKCVQTEAFRCATSTQKLGDGFQFSIRGAKLPDRLQLMLMAADQPDLCVAAGSTGLQLLEGTESTPIHQKVRLSTDGQYAGTVNLTLELKRGATQVEELHRQLAERDERIVKLKTMLEQFSAEREEHAQREQMLTQRSLEAVTAISEVEELRSRLSAQQRLATESQEISQKLSDENAKLRARVAELSLTALESDRRKSRLDQMTTENEELRHRLQGGNFDALGSATVPNKRSSSTGGHRSKSPGKHSPSVGNRPMILSSSRSCQTENDTTDMSLVRKLSSENDELKSRIRALSTMVNMTRMATTAAAAGNRTEQFPKRDFEWKVDATNANLKVEGSTVPLPPPYFPPATGVGVPTKSMSSAKLPPASFMDSNTLDLVVTVVSVDGLSGSEWGSRRSPMVTMKVGSQMVTTDVARGSLRPTFNSTFRFEVMKTAMPERIMVALYDATDETNLEDMGNGELMLSGMPLNYGMIVEEMVDLNHMQRPAGHVKLVLEARPPMSVAVAVATLERPAGATEVKEPMGLGMQNQSLSTESIAYPRPLLPALIGNAETQTSYRIELDPVVLKERYCDAVQAVHHLQLQLFFMEEANERLAIENGFSNGSKEKTVALVKSVMTADARAVQELQAKLHLVETQLERLHKDVMAQQQQQQQQQQPSARSRSSSVTNQSADLFDLVQDQNRRLSVELAEVKARLEQLSSHEKTQALLLDSSKRDLQLVSDELRKSETTIQHLASKNAQLVDQLATETETVTQLRFQLNANRVASTAMASTVQQHQVPSAPVPIPEKATSNSGSVQITILRTKGLVENVPGPSSAVVFEVATNGVASQRTSARSDFTWDETLSFALPKDVQLNDAVARISAFGQSTHTEGESLMLIGEGSVSFAGAYQAWIQPDPSATVRDSASLRPSEQWVKLMTRDGTSVGQVQISIRVMGSNQTEQTSSQPQALSTRAHGELQLAAVKVATLENRMVESCTSLIAVLDNEEQQQILLGLSCPDEQLEATSAAVVEMVKSLKKSTKFALASLDLKKESMEETKLEDEQDGEDELKEILVCVVEAQCATEGTPLLDAPYPMVMMIKVGDLEMRTTSRWERLHPKWNETLRVPIGDASEFQVYAVADVTAPASLEPTGTAATSQASTVAGQTTISMSSLQLDKGPVDMWMPLMTPDHQRVIGRVHLQCRECTTQPVDSEFIRQALKKLRKACDALARGAAAVDPPYNVSRSSSATTTGELLVHLSERVYHLARVTMNSKLSAPMPVNSAKADFALIAQPLLLKNLWFSLRTCATVSSSVRQHYESLASILSIRASTAKGKALTDALDKITRDLRDVHRSLALTVRSCFTPADRINAGITAERLTLVAGNGMAPAGTDEESAEALQLARMRAEAEEGSRALPSSATLPTTAPSGAGVVSNAGLTALEGLRGRPATVYEILEPSESSSSVQREHFISTPHYYSSMEPRLISSSTRVIPSSGVTYYYPSGGLSTYSGARFSRPLQQPFFASSTRSRSPVVLGPRVVAASAFPATTIASSNLIGRSAHSPLRFRSSSATPRGPSPQ